MSDGKQPTEDGSSIEGPKGDYEKENGDSGKTDKVKIDILLKATGNAPIMKKKKWAVDAEKQIGWIMEFVKKYLKLEPDEKLGIPLKLRSASRVLENTCHKDVEMPGQQCHHAVIIYWVSKFLYVNQTFAPSPDQSVKNLYECFGTDGKLVLNYCKSQAWG